MVSEEGRTIRVSTANDLYTFFHCMPAGFTMTALQTAEALVCAHDYRAFRTVQAAQPL